MSRVYFGKAVSGNNYVNNGGTVVQGGNVPSGAPISNVPTTAQVLGYSGRRMTKVPGPMSGADQAAGIPGATAQIDTSGNFALMTAGQYVLRRGGANCDFLAGVANTLLKSGANAAGAHRSIHWEGARRTTPITSWNYATGVATKGSTTSDNFIADVTGNDDAAVPTRAVPGELCYMVTGTTPTTDEYAARTQW